MKSLARPVEAASVLVCFMVPKKEKPPVRWATHMSNMLTAPPIMVPSLDSMGLALRTTFSSL
ncbi:hypothetical protein D3C72_1391300 [compost metagenome]